MDLVQSDYQQDGGDSRENCYIFGISFLKNVHNNLLIVYRENELIINKIMG